MKIVQRLIIGVIFITSANCALASTQEQNGFTLYPEDPNRILPYQLVYEVKPGEIIKDTITVANNGAIPEENLALYPADNKETNGGYDLKTSDEVATNRVVGAWITLESTTVTLQPKEKKQVPITITVPANTPLANYVGGIAIEKKVPATDHPNIMIATRITLKVNIKVTDNPQKIPRFSDPEFKFQQIYLALSIIIFISGIMYYFKVRHHEKHHKSHGGQK